MKSDWHERPMIPAQGAETGGLQVQELSELHSKTLPQKNIKKKKKKELSHKHLHTL